MPSYNYVIPFERDVIFHVYRMPEGVSCPIPPHSDPRLRQPAGALFEMYHIFVLMIMITITKHNKLGKYINIYIYGTCKESIIPSLLAKTDEQRNSCP